MIVTTIVVIIIVIALCCIFVYVVPFSFPLADLIVGYRLVAPLLLVFVVITAISSSHDYAATGWYDGFWSLILLGGT